MLLLIALGYGLGASGVGGQARQVDAAAAIYAGGDYWIAASGRTVWENGVPLLQPVPGSARIVAVGRVSHGFPAAIDELGDIYRYDLDTRVWTRVGNAIGATPTPIGQESWGALKGRYR